MNISPVTIRNWRRRMKVYGIRNSLVLFRSLRKVGEFNLRLYGRDFKLRGNSVDFIVLDSIFNKGEYDFDPGHEPGVIVDAGANIGASTIYLAQRYPGAKILAIEPEGSNFALLEKNLEGYVNVTCIRAGLWSSDTNLGILDPDADKYAFRLRESDSAECNTVRGISIKSLMKYYSIERIDILKMDIEGAEYEIFDSGDLSWVLDTHIIVIELHELIRPGVTELFYRKISEFPYTESGKGENIIVKIKRP